MEFDVIVTDTTTGETVLLGRTIPKTISVTPTKTKEDRNVKNKIPLDNTENENQ